jgi:hypothetical protein
MPESLIVALSRSESTELLICARWCGERSVFCVTEAAEADSFWLWIILLNFGGGALLIINWWSLCIRQKATEDEAEDDDKSGAEDDG